MHIDVREDGYIDATSLCKRGDKRFSAWHANKSSQAFLRSCGKSTSIPQHKLVQISRGVNGRTWIHPLVATQVSQWISSKFAAEVSQWIEQGKELSERLRQEYATHLECIEGDNDGNQIEKEVTAMLQTEEGGELDVCCQYGLVDLVTETEIIEVKNVQHYKHALGQIQAYSLCFADRTRRVHLFYYREDAALFELAKVLMTKFDVRVTGVEL